MPPELNSRPRLSPGCRLGENNQQRQLLMPERALRLNGPSLEIVERCDGKHTVQQIVVDLQKIYSKAEPQKVEQDILSYLTLLQKERALNFEV
jgi:pyrroloquinoline quinone biosynthesis protein D